ncbi:MAG: YciI family protein, partial [Methylococcales bacterium]|nr:YciI family protein [Methylococcales bacterium]
MLYTIISEDVADSLQKRLSVRPAHLARLQDLQDAGRLILAGPHPAIDSENPAEAGFTGSLVVAEFASLKDAQNWADADPYVDAG